MPETDAAQCPWYEEYEEFGIPRSLEPYPDEPAHDLLYTAANEYPDQGLVQLGEKYTYPTVLDHTERLATALAERGIGKGDRVATILPTSVQFIVATCAISRAGGVHIPNDFLDAEDDLVYRLEQGQPSVLIGQDKHRDLISRLQSELDIETVILTTVDDYSPDPPADHDDLDGVEWFRDVIGATDPDPPAVDFDPTTDIHTLLFTGGTTGLPKGCRLSHRNIYANALQGVASQSQMAELMRGQETGIMALPMYHSYGYSVMHSLLELGLNMLLVPDARNTEMMVELINEFGALIMLGVPTQFMELVDEELEQDIIGISGSAPLANKTQQEFEEKSKGISQGYGLSEMSPITHFNARGLLDMITGESSADDAFDHPTIGVPVPDTTVKLIDVDTGEEISIEEAVEHEREGEMYVDGPQRMVGYLDESKSAFDEEGFVATGDVVKIDSSGRFYVVDRVKNMINVSGLKVYTEEIDDVLYDHPGVRRPATVGVPDPDRPGSERVKIYIEPQPDGDDLDAEAIRNHLEEKVPRQALPEEVEFVEKIPLTDIGKTDKKALTE
ncbi:AMP-binding protein [Halocatena pleomorpha]|uniref:Long-chain fatty acid--CoA ligase n=1 Tax=Halocatena pleomorpha TaxID=1785090 RepID=A0A3P3REU2_9EURY|nr:class I adenylate-forming enzyme family protein [Halocatena pleomorpha]RRJ32036.1 long-chain fatty acid--CoA ligase [Halocatena pleomorpha]